MIACTAAYSMMRNFAPDNLTLFNVYLFMLGKLLSQSDKISSFLFSAPHGRAELGMKTASFYNFQ